MRKKASILFLLILSLSSCELILTEYKVSEADIDNYLFVERLFVDATLIADQEFVIGISKTKDPTKPFAESAGNLRVRLYKLPLELCLDTIINFENEKVHIPANLFGSGIDHGDRIRLVINSDIFGELTGETSVPSPVLITDSTLVRFNEDNPLYRLNFEISDPAGINNYFLASSKYKLITYTHPAPGYPTKYDTTVYIMRYQIPLTDPVFKFMSDVRTSLKEPFDISTYYKPRIFSDDVFNGKKYGLTIEHLIRNDNYVNMPDKDFSSTYYFELYSISFDMFEFLRTAYANAIIEGDIYSQPITLYSNIKNGIGFFGAMSSPTIASIRIPENDVLKVD